MKKPSPFIPQLKIADMLAMAGLLLIGTGLGAQLHDHFVGVISGFLLFGVILHALGMYGKYEIEHERFDPPNWVLAIFGLTSIGLGGAALFILIAEFTGSIVN